MIFGFALHFDSEWTHEKVLYYFCPLTFSDVAINAIETNQTAFTIQDRFGITFK